MTTALLLLIRLAEEGPDPEDVKAGWPAFFIFLGLAAAVALLGWSFTRQLRKVDFEEKDDRRGGEDTGSERR